MDESPNTPAIVLAAGGGSRFGGGKLLAPFAPLGGRPLIEASLSALRESPVGEIILVVGKDAEKLRTICEPYGARVVENPDWKTGMSTSVRTGITACGSKARAAVVALADQPFVKPEAIHRLVEAFEGGAEIAVSTYGGKRRNPVLFSREVWPVLLGELSGDAGARVMLEKHPELVTEVPCDDVADPADVDTVEDLRRLEDRAEAEAFGVSGGGRTAGTGQRRS